MCVHFVEKDLQALALIEDMKGAIQVIGEPNEISYAQSSVNASVDRFSCRTIWSL